MQAKLIFAQDREFKNKKGELSQGLNLTFFSPEDGRIKQLFVYNDQLVEKGFSQDMLGKVTGKDLEVFTEVRTINGTPREILEKVQIADK